MYLSRTAFERSGTVSTSQFRADVPTCHFCQLIATQESTRKRCVETLEYRRRHGARPLARLFPQTWLFLKTEILHALLLPLSAENIKP